MSMSTGTSRAAESELGPVMAKRQKLSPATEAEPAPETTTPILTASVSPLAPLPLNSQTRHTADYGNYKGYYTKRKVSLHGDARLAVIPSEWLTAQRVLDVGCNSGVVTIELAQKYRPARVTGVDIDDELIATARRNSPSFFPPCRLDALDS